MALVVELWDRGGTVDVEAWDGGEVELGCLLG